MIFTVVVPQQQLKTFLIAAEELEILGLSKKCANIHIGEPDDFDVSLPEIPSKRRGLGKTKKRKQAEGYEQEIKQEESMFDQEGMKIKRERLDKAYECEACQKKFARKSHLQRHEKVHSDFRPFVCSICEQKFKRKEHCFKHIQTIHDIDDPTAHAEEIKLSEVLDAIESVQSDEEVQEEAGLPGGLDLSKETV